MQVRINRETRTPKGPDGASGREQQTDLGSEESFKDTVGKGRILPLRRKQGMAFRFAYAAAKRACNTGSLRNAS